MNFNKNEFENFQKDIEEAVKKVADKYQVEVKAGKIKYSEFDFTMDLKVVKNDEKTDGNRLKFEKECKKYDFTPEQYKVKFTIQGKEFELVGFNSGSPTNNCKIVSILNGKDYKCNDLSIKKALGIESAIKEATTHKCKYCGATTGGTYADLLCSECRSLFGHPF